MGEYSVKDPIFGAGVWMFGRFVDRYATDGYGPDVPMTEAIRRAAQVGGIEAVDLNFPFWSPDVRLDEIRPVLEETRIRVAAITPEIYSREFVRGAFTNPDAKTRERAVDVVARATEVAYELGADYVKLWPGQDGFDYPLQADHRALWELAIEGVRRVAGPHPDMKFAIEYKPKEPRVHIVFSDAARTLLAIDEIGLDNVGILLDVGHSLYAGESPADAVQLILRRGRLLGIDFNDNFRSWDDDLAVGSVHFFETLEFLLALRRHGWEGIWQLDQFPFREDPVEAARSSIRVLRAMNRLLDRIDLDRLRAVQDAQDGLAAQRLVHEVLLGDLLPDEQPEATA
jgi:xylose isomerase